MSTIGNNAAGNNPAGNISGVTQPQPTASTTAASGVSAVSPNIPGSTDGIDSVAGRATVEVSPKPVNIDFDGGEVNFFSTGVAAMSMGNRGNRMGVKTAAGSYERGEVEVASVVPTDKGCRVTVHVKKKVSTDAVVLELQAQIQDGDKGSKVLVMTRLGEKYGNPPVSTVSTSDYDELVTYDLDYDTINAAFAKHAPSIQIKANSPLAIFGRFNGNMHESGGFHRLGAFYLPQRNTLPIGIATIGADSNERGTLKPMDMEVVYPESVVKQYSTALKAGGKAMSRVEAEAKIDVPLDKIFDVYHHI
ncbi:hypothetical protein KAI87_13645, partial [Myxococcota bacterium]|nr:hypothetical protein [Myxococcota bacterium]